MDLQRYRAFTQQLQANLESDPRVLGLIAMGSMAESGRLPDGWSDHDFWVVTVSGEQESFRKDLSWLPDTPDIVMSIRETHHGLKVLYSYEHLVEFAVFDLDEMAQSKANDYHVLFDRAAITELMQTVTRPPVKRDYDAHHDFTMVLALLYVGCGRYARGEQLSAHAFIKYFALHHLLPLLRHVLPAENKRNLDNLDSFRRFEQVFPEASAILNPLLLLPAPQTAAGMVAYLADVLPAHLPDYPEHAVQTVQRYIQRVLDQS